ncbi:MAG: bb3-type cytochrome oxidase subunit IV, partial [Gammaproteobacteria bacterium]
MSESSGQVAQGGVITDLVTDWIEDKEVFKVNWGKAMMWIFLLSDTFIFTS